MLLTLTQQHHAMEINTHIGWDAFIDYVQTTTHSHYLRAQCKKYYKGYRYMTNSASVDDGKCGKIRQKAIQNILKTFTISY